ncbi:MAG: hypothetical protein ACTSXT_10290 [Candidatus Helarchaeota archaeon]
MDNKIKQLINDLKDYLSDKNIISRLELRTEIKSLIKRYNIQELDEIIKFEKKDDSSILRFIFNSIISTHSIPNAPFLPEKLIYENIIFYYPQPIQNIDEIIKSAFDRYCEFIIKKMRDKVHTVYFKANYHFEDISDTRFLAIRGNLKQLIIFYPTASILYNDLKSMIEFEDSIIIIPQGATPAPYFNIYKEFSDALLLEENIVLLFNTEEDILSPFIGLPKDELIIHQLKPDKNIIQFKRQFQNFFNDEEF